MRGKLKLTYIRTGGEVENLAMQGSKEVCLLAEIVKSQFPECLRGKILETKTSKRGSMLMGMKRKWHLREELLGSLSEKHPLTPV